MLLIFAHILGDSVSRSEIAGRLEQEETSDSFRKVDEKEITTLTHSHTHSTH